MNVAYLTPFGAQHRGGVPVVVEALSSALAVGGDCALSVLCAKEDGIAGTGPWEAVSLKPLPTLGPISLGFLRELPEQLEATEPEVIHIHGVWTFLSYQHLKFQKTKNIPYLISPHGMLDEWALSHSKWKKKIVERVFERAHLERANVLVALCESELKSIRAYGLKNPVAVIPNGVALPDLSLPIEHCCWCGETRKALLFVGRVHPKKGLPLLIQAWAKLKKSDPSISTEWFVAIAGDGDADHLNELKESVCELELSDDIQFLGPIYGESKVAALRQASAFILPSYSEGLPMSVLEAWAYELPSLITPECNLPDGFVTDSAIRIETEVDSIATAINEMVGFSNDERLAMGRRARALVCEKYTWQSVSEQMASVYRWLLKRAERPNCVHIAE